MLRPPSIQFEPERPNRVSWKSNSAHIVCRGCYIMYQHMLPEYTHPNPDYIACNVESLNEYEKGQILDKYYLVANTIVMGTSENAFVEDGKDTSHPKKRGMHRYYQ